MKPRHIAAAFLLASSWPAEGQRLFDLSLKAVKVTPPAYESISFVTEGAATGGGSGEVRGKFQRILVLNPELAYERPTLRFETLTYGDEACCRKIVSAYETDLNELPDLGVPLPPAATTELRFSRWLSASTAEFRYGELTCAFRGVGNRTMKVACRK